MKGYKTIDQFNLKECETFLKSATCSQYEGLVRQRYAKLQEEEQMAAHMSLERERQERYEQAAKDRRCKTRNNILLALFSILVIAAGILIYITYTD